jgi:hypothetical protein
MPAERERDLLKSQMRQTAMQRTPGGAGRAVLRVPEARMAELVLATEQYRAQRNLNEEVASISKSRTEKKSEAFKIQEEERPLEKAAKEAVAPDAKPTAGTAEEEYVQIVLDIQPRSMAEASEAARTEEPANAKIPATESKQ